MKKTLIIAALAALTLTAYAQEPVKDWAKTNRYQEANKAITQKPKAVFMGDSITEGWAREDPDFFSANNFVGRGISGQTTAEMLVRFRQDVVALQPKYVLIMAGTNDVALNNGPISDEAILENLKAMCQLAKVNGIKPILCSLPACDRFSWRKEVGNPADHIAKLNEDIKAYAKEAHIRYIDYHTAMKGEGNNPKAGYTKDGCHPTLDFYKIMEGIALSNVK